MMLKELKSLNYPIKGYVSDGNPDIPRVVERIFGNIPHQLCVRHYLQGLRVKLREGRFSERTYQDACRKILNGKRPRYLDIPDELFTYKQISNLPRTNQSVENLFRYFTLRLKTVGQFNSWTNARDYCNALTLMRRFTKFTDRKNQPNHLAPLELAGVDIRGIDYLRLR